VAIGPASEEKTALLKLLEEKSPDFTEQQGPCLTVEKANPIIGRGSTIVHAKNLNVACRLSKVVSFGKPSLNP